MYTIQPKQKFAKASGTNVRISQKNAVIVCKVIRKKTLKRARRLLEDLRDERRSLGGKYYSHAVKEILHLLNSCEKNAEFAGLEKERLFVHASASMGTIMRRRRRKSAFGSRMKSANVEVMLIERGTEKKAVNAVQKKAGKAETKKESVIAKQESD